MLFECEDFAKDQAVRNALCESDGIFRYCTFQDALIEGGVFDGVFIGCKFTNLEFYWGLFNTSIFCDCHFTHCTFEGTSFAGCRLLDSSFTACQFLKDQLSAECRAPDTKLYSVKLTECIGRSPFISDEQPSNQRH